MDAYVQLPRSLGIAFMTEIPTNNPTPATMFPGNLSGTKTCVRKKRDLQDILGFTTNLARKAGALTLEGSHAIQHGSGPGSVGEKKNAVDLVTEYDGGARPERDRARAHPRFHL